MRLSLILFGLLAACTTSEKTTEKVATKTPEATTADQAKKVVDASKLEEASKDVEIVPSPLKMQKMLQDAGITTRLSELIKNRTFKTDSNDKDHIAVISGVLLADLVLNVEKATPKKLVEQLETLKGGFKKLGAGEDIQATIDEMKETVTQADLDRAALLTEMDLLSSVLVPELEYEAGTWVVPLIQAGSWLEGANLIAAALKKEGKSGKDAKLLQQPEAVNYFLGYVNHEGRSKAPDALINRLEKTLKDLKIVAEKTEFSAADVEEVNKLTDGILSLL